MKVDWFRAEYKGATATMKQEKSDFWSVDSSKLLRNTHEPYILPAHCEQAFLYAPPDSCDPWRQIVPINPRGRRLYDTIDDVGLSAESFQDNSHEQNSTSITNHPLTGLSHDDDSSQEESGNDTSENEMEDAIENDNEGSVEPLLLNSFSSIANLETELTTEEIQETLKDNEEIDLIIDLFSNLDET